MNTPDSTRQATPEARANARRFAIALTTATVVKVAEGDGSAIDLLAATLSRDAVHDDGWGWEVLLTLSEAMGLLCRAISDELELDVREVWRAAAELIEV